MLNFKERLDRTLVDLELVESRTKAQVLIKSGAIKVNGVVITKSNHLVEDDSKFEIINNPCPWVSRAGLKLEGALKYFKPPLNKDSVCLDIGASTGGFSQVLLSKNVKMVYAIDVGTNQLHDIIRNDKRVVVMEKTDARDLDINTIAPVDMIVVDVSFIGLEKILEVPFSLAKQGAGIIALIKPQFQVGKPNIGKGGIVKDNGSVDVCIKEIQSFFEKSGWSVQGVVASDITGGTGNQEYLLYAIMR